METMGMHFFHSGTMFQFDRLYVCLCLSHSASYTRTRASIASSQCVHHTIQQFLLCWHTTRSPFRLDSGGGSTAGTSGSPRLSVFVVPVRPFDVRYSARSDSRNFHVSD